MQVETTSVCEIYEHVKWPKWNSDRIGYSTLELNSEITQVIKVCHASKTHILNTFKSATQCIKIINIILKVGYFVLEEPFF